MKMILTLTSAVLAFATSPATYARIGETLEQCEARYGEAVLKDLNVANENCYSFYKGGLEIWAFMVDNKVTKISFTQLRKRDGDPAPLSEEHIKTLLKASYDGDWIEVGGTELVDGKKQKVLAWSSADDRLTAMCSPGERTLTIFTNGVSAKKGVEGVFSEDVILEGF